MWYDSLRVTSDASHEADEVPQIVVNGYSFAERCQRLGKAIEWVKREMVCNHWSIRSISLDAKVL